MLYTSMHELYYTLNSITYLGARRRSGMWWVSLFLLYYSERMYTPDAGLGGPAGTVRARSRTDASPGRLGGDGQVRGAYGGSDRSRYRPARGGRDPKSPAVGSTHPHRSAHSHAVCTNGWDRSPGREERDGG